MASNTISTVGGGGTALGDGGAAKSASLSSPMGAAVDNTGNLYIADTGHSRIRKVTPDGTIASIAGTGTFGNSADGGPAAAAQLSSAANAATVSAGSIYIDDAGNHRVRVIYADGTIAAFSGSGTAGNTGDGGPATSARLNSPAGAAVDGTGNVYIGDNATDTGRVRMVITGGVIHKIGSTSSCGFSGDGCPALSAQFYNIMFLAVDNMERVYSGDAYNERVRVLVPGQ